MARKKRIRMSTRRKLVAASQLTLALILIGLGWWFFDTFVIKADHTGHTPGTEPVQTFLPDGGYIREAYPPIDPNATPEPLPLPTPKPTPIPLEKYAMLNRRMLMPTEGYEKVNCGLIEFRISQPDDNRAFAVRGWGYLEGMDAAKSTVYLVISPKYGDNHRAYLMNTESGSTGVYHDPRTGTNLDMSDFNGCIRIEETYADGEYRLGVLVLSSETDYAAKSYARLSDGYNFMVKGSQIVGMAKDVLH